MVSKVPVLLNALIEWNALSARSIAIESSTAAAARLVLHRFWSLEMRTWHWVNSEQLVVLEQHMKVTLKSVFLQWTLTEDFD